MNQSELIAKIAEATELTQTTAGAALKVMVHAIVDAVAEGEAVRVSGFGIFAVTKRPPRRGRNPRTGESVEIAASNALRFRAGRTVKDVLNPLAPAATRGSRHRTGRIARGF